MNCGDTFNGDNKSIKPRRQHYVFAHQYLRDIVLNYPQDAVKHLGSDAGVNFLKSQWEIFSSQEAYESFIPANNLNCFPFPVSENCTVIIVQFPTPKCPTEAYFAGIVAFRSEAEDWSCRYFTLELMAGPQQSQQTVLGE